MRSWMLVLALLTASTAAAQEAAQLDRATREALQEQSRALSAAQQAEDEEAIKAAVARSVALLGDQAGRPEVVDTSQTLPGDARPLTAGELTGAFLPYLERIERRKWWKVGLDPSRTNHAPREVASVIEGCLAARKVSPALADRLLRTAREAGDFLVWAQQQGTTGVIPFPAVRNGQGRPFEVAERFYRRAERDGVIDQVVKNGWTVEDLDDGGLQFDNGLSGVALLHLFEATGEPTYRAAALRAADWAMGRRVVPNWNYNSFSVALLAEAYRVSGKPDYLQSACKKARLGVLPGQLREGPRRGRWADPHNARPAYHYIMVRGLAALAEVLPAGSPELPGVVDSLRLALLARNPDVERGLINVDSTIEALIRVSQFPPRLSEALGDCRNAEVLDVLERFAAAGFRSRRGAISPGAWGQLLAYRHGGRG